MKCEYDTMLWMFVPGLLTLQAVEAKCKLGTCKWSNHLRWDRGYRHYTSSLSSLSPDLRCIRTLHQNSGLGLISVSWLINSGPSFQTPGHILSRSESRVKIPAAQALDIRYPVFLQEILAPLSQDNLKHLLITIRGLGRNPDYGPGDVAA